MSASQQLMHSHDIIDNIERQVLEEDGIHLVIHLDPISDDDEEISNHREMALKTVQTIDPRLTIHDFRMVKGDDHTNLIFDVVMPPEFGNEAGPGSKGDCRSDAGGGSQPLCGCDGGLQLYPTPGEESLIDQEGQKDWRRFGACPEIDKAKREG